MNNKQFFIYLIIMAGSTYLIRMVPFILAKKKIENKFVKSFLYYIPYAVLSAMTIPAVFYATSSPLSAICGVVAAVVLAMKGFGLTVVAIVSCVVAFLGALVV